jgi:hypothetical protein
LFFLLPKTFTNGCGPWYHKISHISSPLSIMISACFLARFQELQAYDRKESLACKLYESIILRISIG